MTKQLAIQDENISHLAEEIKAIISQARDSATIGMIAAKYMVGEAIKESPLYRKHAKGQAGFYEAVAREADMRSDTLADCVKFYVKYPHRKPEALARKLWLEYGAWRNVRLALYGGSSERRSESEARCRHCPLHYPQRCP